MVLLFLTALVVWIASQQKRVFVSAPDAPLASVNLEDLTWTEVARALTLGYDTVIIPTGGTEQNGPHVVLGKHNYVVGAAAEAIAKELGNTLVAPVIAYVPQGAYGAEPTLHMRFPGTISLTKETFAALLSDTARSFETHGFRRIFFIGDSGSSQATQEAVAEFLSQEWQDRDVQVRHLSDYYSENGQTKWLLEQGYTLGQIGSHAAIRDTSEVISIAPSGVRTRFVPPPLELESGYDGAPSLATAQIGEHMLQLKVQAAVRQIENLTEQ